MPKEPPLIKEGLSDHSHLGGEGVWGPFLKQSISIKPDVAPAKTGVPQAVSDSSAAVSVSSAAGSTLGGADPGHRLRAYLAHDHQPLAPQEY